MWGTDLTSGQYKPALRSTSSLGYLAIKSVVAPLNVKLTAHIAEDTVRFNGIHESLARLEHGQEATNRKLDRLIERSIR